MSTVETPPQGPAVTETADGPSSLTSLLWRIYGVGLAVMIFFNFSCYPGSEVGIFGWAVIWPLYVPANLIRILISLEVGDAGLAAALWGEVCQEAVIGLRTRGL